MFYEESRNQKKNRTFIIMLRSYKSNDQIYANKKNKNKRVFVIDFFIL